MPLDVKFSFFDKPKVLFLLLVVLCSYFFLQHQYRAVDDACKCADAYAYLTIGEIYSKLGISDHNWARLRLYGYPIFLSLIIKVAQIINVPLMYALFTTQLLLYISSIYILAWLISSRFSVKMGNLVFYALVSNLFIYPYLVLPLTDGFSVILFLFISSVVVKIAFNCFDKKPLSALTPWFFLLGCLNSFAVMVRPANLYFIGMAFVAIAILIVTSKQKKAIFLAATVFGAGFFIVTIPQIYFNYATYKVFSFLPVFDLGSYQIETGKQMIKYATNLSGGVPGLPYINPWFKGEETGRLWYIHNPINGAITMFLHVFGAFDFDYLFCYLYDLHPPYRPLLFLISHFVLFWSIVGYFLMVSKLFKQQPAQLNGHEKVAIKWISLTYPLLLAGWFTVHATAAVENRFSLPIVAILFPLSAWAGWHHLRVANYKLLVCFALYLVGAWQVSHFISSLMILPKL